ncbi:putative EEIG1/EHBP1 domain-containing protein [Medicago truncatula]|uniref:Plastid movement impaired protein n=1 Tax=Medicago truncatula TaxID=3880 RepID=A0A072UBY1_MEDTR|nr:protein PLASTID MOVEMENT IMPAIRED 1 [Medicago truncatula]KEH26956.1 plastid movement impaired protein [Medicago truncatula]RHN52680.1 putative EEIG1/EHBP1 domain-containing protein [Medicago truncatula]
MAADNSTKRNSNVQLLEELEALSDSLYQSHTTARRAASLALPRTSVPFVPSAKDDNDTAKLDNNKNSNKPRSRRMSLSPWKSKTNQEDANGKSPSTQSENNKFEYETTNSGDNKKGIWNWKPIRAISHIGKQKISCLFSVEILTAQSLPSSMNGLRLSVCVRKKENKDGAVQTMPSRVSQGAADFEETLFLRCHVYCNQQGNGKNLKFEPRPFWIYLFAVDAKELDFGRNSVDLSQLVQESIEKNRQGNRVRQWETSFSLQGKAKGGELVVKLGFQVMGKDGGVEIYNNEENLKPSSRFKNLTSTFARRRSKTSFSMPSPRITNRNDAWTPSQRRLAEDIQEIDDLNLDDDPNPNPVHHSYPSTKKRVDDKEKVEDLDLPEFEVVDRGIEVEEKKEDEGEGSEKSIEVKSASSEIVKEIVHDQLHLTRLNELDSLSKQIKALESMMGEQSKDFDTESQRLDSDEENVTREFLHMLEDQKSRLYKLNQSEIPPLHLEEHDDNSSSYGESNSQVYLPDLGKGLGCVVQTRDGGYLASMNPLDNYVARNDTPKLAMQMSKPFVLTSQDTLNGLELFQKLAAIDLDELTSQIFSLMPIDELIGKTAEQIAFEGIASAIIQGRNKEGASSSAARIVSALKDMANAMSLGRQERISTGIWNVDDIPLTAEKILAFTMQKIEFMAIEALKIQAGIAEEEAPFEVSSVKEGNKEKDLLSSAISLEDWIRDQSSKNTNASSDIDELSNITLMFVVQLRDPIRRYEAVGGPMMVLIHTTNVDTKGDDHDEDDEEKRFKVSSMHVGGFKVRSGGGRKNAWESEKQRLTSMQWLIEYGLGKAGKKGKHALVKGQDLLWSISSRIMAEMWLKTIRNPDVRLV